MDPRLAKRRLEALQEPRQLGSQRHERPSAVGTQAFWALLEEEAEEARQILDAPVLAPAGQTPANWETARWRGDLSHGIFLIPRSASKLDTEPIQGSFLTPFAHY